MNIPNKKILITGGFGFIGSNLKKQLETLGASVEIFDLENGNNIRDPKTLKRFLKREYDIIYHLAAYSGSAEVGVARRKFFEVNTFATINLLELLAKYSPKTKLILSSSRLEYGKPVYLPVDEKHPTLPTCAYGLSKLAATQMALAYHYWHNLDITIFRTSNTYGPHKTHKFVGYNVINYFIDLAKKNKGLTVYGSGNQLRDYIYISDLVRAFILAAQKNTTSKIYNLGFGEGIKFKDMAKLIVNTVGSGTLKFVSWPVKSKTLETGSYVSNINLVNKELGFKPEIGFEMGIKLTLKGF